MVSASQLYQGAGYMQCFFAQKATTCDTATETFRTWTSYSPDDTWLLIFQQLDLKSLVSVEQTCRHFRDTIRRSERLLFKSAYQQDGTRPVFKQAAQVLDVYVSRPGVDWRRACMFRQGLVAVCEYARRKEEVAMLKVFAQACRQTLTVDKEDLKSLKKRAEAHNVCCQKWQRRGERELAENERAARDQCLGTIANKEEAIRLWQLLLPQFMVRIRATEVQEAAARKRLKRICNGYPKMQVHVPRSRRRFGFALTLLNRLWPASLRPLPAEVPIIIHLSH